MNVTGNNPLDFVAALNDSQFHAGIRRMEQSVNRTASGVINQGSQIESFARQAAQATTAFFSVQAAESFVSSLVQVRNQFQQLDIAFSTMLKSKSAADQLMKDLVVFAGTTPFGLKEAAGASKQLLAYGSTAKTVVGELRMLGDVASGVSVPIGDLVYLYGTLKTQGRAYAMDIRQFAGRGIPIYAELAKVLGVAKENVADLVSAGKVGFVEVEQAFKNMTSTGGMFSGLMEAQSKSWGGQIERLKDAWDVMLNDMGKSQDSFFVSTISSLSYLVTNYQKVLDIIGSLIVGYGAYRAALILTAATTSILTYTTAGFTAAEILSYYWTQTLTKAQKLLNATMLANPYAAVAAALAAITTYLVLTEDATLKVRTAAELTADAVKNQGDSVSTAESKLRVYIEMLKNTNLSEGERLNIYNKMKDIDPKIVNGIDAKTISYANLKNGVDEYIKSLREKFRLEAQEGAIKASMQKETELKQSIVDIGNETDIWMKLGLQSPGRKRERENRINETRDILLKQQIETNKLIGNSVQTGSKEQIKAAEKDLAIIESQKKLYKKGSVELLTLQQQYLEKQAEINTLRNVKKPGEVEAKFVVIKNKPFYENIIKQNTEDLEALDKGAKDFEAKAAPLKKKIQDAQRELLSFSVTKPGKLDNDEKAALKRKSDMLEKIFDLNEKYNTKALTDDQQKLQEIRNEFIALQKDIEAYNADPKNKKINPNLKPALEKALENKQYEVDTVKLKTQLENQKGLYTEYEEYKSKLGKDAADKRFKNEFDLSTTYLEELKYREQEILSKGKENLTGPEQERLKIIQDGIDQELAAQKKKYDELVKGLVSYESERKVLIEKYNADIKTLENNPKAQAERTKRHLIELKSLDEANLKKLESYQRLFKGIEDLSKKSALKVVSDARSLLQKNIASGEIIDSDEIEKIRDYFEEVENTIKSGTGDQLVNVANQIDKIVTSIGGMDSAFGKVLSTVSNVVGQVGNIHKGMDDFNKEGAKPLDKLGAGLGIVSAGISIFQTVFSLFDRSKQREEQAAYAQELQNKQTESLNKALERQISLLDEVYGTERITNYDAAIKEAQLNEEKYLSQLESKFLLTDDKTVNKLITNLNNVGKTGLNWGNKNEEKFKESLSKLPKDIEMLQRLLNEGKLDDTTATIVLNLIKANQAAIDLKNNLRKELTGTSLDSIADGLISTLMDGTQDFGKSFEDVIQKSIINGFKGELIRKQLQAFYTQFAELADGGLTKDEIEKLKLTYMAAGEKAKKELEDLEKVTGISLTDKEKEKEKETSPNSAVGAIRRDMTEETAGILTGLWRGTYDLTKQSVVLSTERNEILRPIGKTALELLNIAKANFDVALRIEANTRRTADNTDGVSSTLKEIAKNTKPTMTSRGMGI
jgi:hypothetical protein